MRGIANAILQTPWLLAGYAALGILGCVQNPSEPETAEDRCEILCNSLSADHPCVGEQPADDCVATCTGHTETLVDGCLTCVLSQSGFIGSACVCEQVDDFGSVDVTCEVCTYTTHDTKCEANAACTRDLAVCDGFVLVEPTGPACAPACSG